MSFISNTSKMSFYRITNPKKRDAMVNDYVSTMKRLRQRELQERLGDFSYYHDQERQLKPLIESNDQVIKQFVDLEKFKKESKEEEVKKDEPV